MCRVCNLKEGMKMKIIEKWNEVDRRQAGAGMQVLYELGGY